VLLAHKLALASDLVSADMVEATEFPHLAQRYQVHAVPLTAVATIASRAPCPRPADPRMAALGAK
jgi:hypothetical protein